MKLTCLWALAALFALPTQAAVVSPQSYSLPNGNVGSFVYFDGSYTGSGDVNSAGAALTGGLGDLTDGIIPTENWNVVEAPEGNGPYVGWLNTNPVIEFFFDAVQSFTSVTFHFDDANGGGGVSAPLSVTVNGISAAIADPSSSAPFAFTLDLTGSMATDQLSVQIFRRTEWLFLSEVTFENDMPTVPLPAGLPLLAGGLGLLALMRRRA